MLRFFSLFVFVLLMGIAAIGQNPPDTVGPVADTPKQVPVTPRDSTNTNPNPKIDSPVTPPEAPRLTVPTPPPAPQVDSTPSAQDSTEDSVNTVVAPPPAMDSFSWRPFLIGMPWIADSASPLPFQIIQRHPFFNFATQPIIAHSVFRKVEGKEVMFYTVVGFLLIFALLRQGFGKYFIDMLRVFFRTTMKQRQIREQLMQNPFPSLVFNIFFVASAGLYINFLLEHFTITPVSNFWLMYLYCCIGLIVIYTGKYISLKLIGWLLNMKKAAEAYIFIVFMINKMIGVLLVPFIVLLAFTNEPMYTVSMVLSWCAIGSLLLYRFILGYSAIRKEVKFNLFHFLLYLAAFEVAPLLVIYKLLLLVFN